LVVSGEAGAICGFLCVSAPLREIGGLKFKYVRKCQIVDLILAVNAAIGRVGKV